MRNQYMIAFKATAAKAIGRNLQISPKASIELANFLRGKDVSKAMNILNRVMEKEQAIPYKRFTNGPGHKPGMAAGRYPVKAAGEFLKLLKNAKANAANQGLTGTLIISHIAVNRASEPFRQRAKERNTFKRCHVEVALTESKAEAKKDKKPEAPVKAEKPKALKTEKAKPAQAEVAA